MGVFINVSLRGCMGGKTIENDTLFGSLRLGFVVVTKQNEKELKGTKTPNCPLRRRSRPKSPL